MSEKEFKVGKAVVRLVKGDITDMETDAIVNAANSSLMGGGGVDGAIHRKGGTKILEECKLLRSTKWPNGLPVGNAVITSGGKLKARYVIHTVGPIWRGGGSNEPKLLASAYENSLIVAKSERLRTIAFPSISTGAYGYPVSEASRVALRTVKAFLEEMNYLTLVFFVLFSDSDIVCYMEWARRIL
jgi:O-acetyl-ADP-ribose deacetylase (regulator of RNase III)